MLLQEFKQDAISAHRWTSFSPEKRGENLIESYSKELETDIRELTAAGCQDVSSYVDRYKRLFSAYLGAKSRVASPMITGPARFPTNKIQKSIRSEENHYNIWRAWREKAKKAIIKSLEPEITYMSEIERLKTEIERRKQLHETMKACNVVIRKAKGADCTDALVKLGLSKNNAIEIQKPDYANRIGFARFSMTNSLASIKNKEQRLKELERKEASRIDAENTGNSTNEFPIEGGQIILNFEENRLQIIYDSKPDEATRDKLKHNGFKWAPSQGAWQRQLTNNALWCTERLFSIKLKRI